MTILTERLLIRSYAEGDAPALRAILGDPTTMRFWPRPFTPDEADAWLERAIARRAESSYGRRAVLLRASGALVGDVGVARGLIDGEERDDLGYIIHHPHWRQGYALEAARAALTDWFTHARSPALYANMAHDHRGSQRVAERLGMRRVGAFDNPRNRGIHTFVYALARDEWRPHP